MKKILALVNSFVLAIGVNVQSKDLVYHDATQFPLYGTAVKNDSVTYTRLPDSFPTSDFSFESREK